MRRGRPEWSKKVQKKLAKEAWQHYQADEVINVEFWPDPAGKSFPRGYMFARGEMVKYEPFPSSEE